MFDTWSAAVLGNDGLGHSVVLKSTEAMGHSEWISQRDALYLIDQPLKVAVERKEAQARRKGAQYDWKIYVSTAQGELVRR
jgi:hypothetical protein